MTQRQHINPHASMASREAVVTHYLSSRRPKKSPTVCQLYGRELSQHRNAAFFCRSSRVSWKADASEKPQWEITRSLLVSAATSLIELIELREGSLSEFYSRRCPHLSPRGVTFWGHSGVHLPWSTSRYRDSTAAILG